MTQYSFYNEIFFFSVGPGGCKAGGWVPSEKMSGIKVHDVKFTKS